MQALIPGEVFDSRMLALAAAAWAVALAGQPAAAQAGDSKGAMTVNAIYKQASAAVADRVADLLPRLSQAEKLAQLLAVSEVQAAPAVAAGHLLRSGSSSPRPPALAPSRWGIPPLLHETAWPTGNAWPSPLALAASWDPALAREAGAAAGRAARARGSHLVRGPSLDVTADPRRGRVEQGFGEAPLLVAAMGSAMVDGLQAGGVLAAPAHFASAGLAAEGSEVGPAPSSRRELSEVYLPPFEAAIRSHGVQALVVSRAALDAVPAHADRWLLAEVLRQQWGFAGAVFADPAGIADLLAPYRIAASVDQAAALALHAGVDAGFAPGSRLPPSPQLDAAVARVLALKFRAGLFDAPAPPVPPAAAAATALDAARRAVTLLKNSGVLPIAPASRVAVIEAADAANSIARRLRSPTDAQAEIVIVAAPSPPLELLRALKARGRRVVVVLTGAQPELAPEVAEIADALVAAWGLGEQSGQAIADVLCGDVNPSGKLPLTLARHAGQLPSVHNAKPSARRGFLFESVEPLFAFGWGLGYSRFEIGVPRLSSPTLVDGSVELGVDLRNSGPMAGVETVQLYLRHKTASMTQPVKRLIGFQQAALAAGEQRRLRFAIAAQDLAILDRQLRPVVEAGEVELMVGPDSQQLQSVTLSVAAGAPR